MGHIIWSSDDFAMGLCVEHSDDVALSGKLGKFLEGPGQEWNK